MASYIDQVLEKLQEFEGSVPWMYLDTVGKVTVGVGLMLPNEAAADVLPFLVDGRSATPEETAAEFARVSAMARGRAAKFYSRSGGLRLPEAVIITKLREVLEGFEGYLRRNISGYEALPDPAKVALLDMVYNLGPGRLFAEFPHLIAAVEAGDWRKAAAASVRRGPSAGRNDWTRQQLLAAAGAVTRIQAAAESALLRYGLFAVGVLAAVLVGRALESRRAAR